MFLVCLAETSPWFGRQGVQVANERERCFSHGRISSVVDPLKFWMNLCCFPEVNAQEFQKPGEVDSLDLLYNKLVSAK